MNLPRMPVAGRPELRAVVALGLLAIAVGACGRGPGTSSTSSTDTSNTCTTSVDLPMRSAALEQRSSLDAVTWTAEPKIVASDGTLVAGGTLKPGMRLFDPLTSDGDRRDTPAFSVYHDYDGNKESSVELAPELPADQCWETQATVAGTFTLTSTGQEFKIEASSPLFRDLDVSKVELRVWGTDASGAEALLSVSAIGSE